MRQKASREVDQKTVAFRGILLERLGLKKKRFWLPTARSTEADDGTTRQRAPSLAPTTPAATAAGTVWLLTRLRFAAPLPATVRERKRSS
jgi:hypothetical protein